MAIVTNVIIMNPATEVLQKLGGPADTARALNVARQAVYRWTWPRERGGTGGTIPQKHHLSILRIAKERGVEISADDMLPRESAQ